MAGPGIHSKEFYRKAHNPGNNKSKCAAANLQLFMASTSQMFHMLTDIPGKL
jgi:hypothetical protein